MSRLMTRAHVSSTESLLLSTRGTIVVCIIRLNFCREANFHLFLLTYERVHVFTTDSLSAHIHGD